MSTPPRTWGLVGAWRPNARRAACESCRQVSTPRSPVGADGLAELSGRAPGVGPRAIELLPAWIDPAELPASEHRSTTGRSVRRLVLGRRADDLEPAILDVPAGDHIFIGGAGRTGTSTVLAQVAAAWRSLEGERSVVEWLRRSPSWSDELAAAAMAGNPSGLLLVIDDAHRVDDTDGAIASDPEAERR